VLIGLLATLGALTLVIGVAIVTAPTRTPDVVPAWGPLNTGQIEQAVRAALQTTARDPQLLELARHHAFDRAARDYSGPQSPEGEDHADRRRRLAPTLVGVTTEWNVGFQRTAGTREDEVARQVLAALPEEARQGDGALEVGAAVEQGRVAVTVVRGARLATLDEPPVLGVSGGLWSLRGHMAGGRAPDLFEAIVHHDGVALPPIRSALRGDPPDDADRPLPFLVDLTLPDGADPLRVELRADGLTVLEVPVRT